MMIIHLSDIHISDNCNSISFIPMYEAIKHELRIEKDIIFIISGDIAFSGNRKQYEKFSKLYDEIAFKINESNPTCSINIILSPGNHDCDFTKNNSMRKLSIKSIKERGLDAIGDDTTVIDSCTSIQDDFFEYLDLETGCGNLKGYARLSYTRSIITENIVLDFTCYNTSWLSSIEEDPGSLFFPVKILTSKEKIGIANHLNIGVYHHPDNWLSPNHDESNHKDFRNFITRTNDIILSGHEHTEALSEYKDLSNGYSCIFHESNAYFKNNNYGGFNILTIDSNKNISISYYNFDKSRNIFIEKESFKHDSNDLNSSNRNFQVIKNFKDYLNDNEVFLASPSSQELMLRDLYTYPKIENIKTGALEESDKILHESTIENIIVFGADQSGKTSLLKNIFHYWYYNGYVPLLIDGKVNISNMNIKQALKNVYKKQYNDRKKSFDDYLSLDIDKKIILIDNFHMLNEKLSKVEILEKFSGFSKRIIVILNDVSSLDENVLGLDGQLEFKKYSILPFGNVNREQLIEKWLRFQSIEGKELFKQKIHTHNRVNDILGINLVPSYPLFIITILQALEANTSTKSEITSYGHCYQTLIYLSFKKIGLKDDEFTVIDNFLAYIAYYIYENTLKSISSEQMELLHSEYGKDYIISNSTTEIINLLLTAKLLLRDSLGNLSFKYIYIYYFYVAKYLSRYKLDNKSDIEILCKNLSKKENSFIILFLTHHTNNKSILETIVLNTMYIFEDIDPIELTKDETNFMTDFVKNVTETVLENIQPEEFRDRELKKKDLAEKNTSNKEDISKANEELDKINKAYKSIEIIGQIIKNRYGSIQKTYLNYMVEESFLISFRLIRAC